MNRGGILFAAAAAAVAAGIAAAAGRAARRTSHRGERGVAGAGASCGWATCSAPSARAYELAFGWMLGGLYRRMADDLASTLAGSVDAEVLEVGSGPGHLAVLLAGRVPGARITGLDIDPGMVERARSRAARAGAVDRLTFVVGDVAALPYPEGRFDLVASSFSAHHWPDAAAGFREIRRVLRPGGRAIVYDLPDGWGRLEQKAAPLAAAAEAGGFPGARVAPFRWPGPVGIVRRLDAVVDRPVVGPAD